MKTKSMIAFASILFAVSLYAADFVVYPFSYTSNICATFNVCPSNYCSYNEYRKWPTNGFGWAPDTNFTIHTATYTNGGNVRTEYIDRLGSDMGCSMSNSISTSTHPLSGNKYIFSVLFTNSIPGTNGLLLHGFLP